MTKNEYMTRLDAALRRFSEQTRADVLEDYEAHFANALENGRTEEEICEELGPIDLFIEELSQMEPAATSAASQAAPSPQTAAASPYPAGTSSDQNGTQDQTDAPDSSSYQSRTARKLVLEGLNADVTMTPSPTDTFNIQYQNHGTIRQRMQYQFYFREENGVIYAGIRKQRIFDGFFNLGSGPQIDLNVHIPSMMTDIQANTVSGDIKAGNLQLSKFKLHTVNGDMDGSGLTAQFLEVHATNGDIDMRQIASPKTQFHSVNGDIHVDGRITYSKAETVNGDIELETQYAAELEVGTVSGDIDVRSHAGAHGSLHSVNGDILLDLGQTTSGYSIDISTINGDWNVKRRCNSIQRNRRSGHAEIDGEGTNYIKLSTVSGDITVR